MMNAVDVFSQDFFAEDPFGDQNSDSNSSNINRNDDLVSIKLDLQTTEESICHSRVSPLEAVDRQSEGRESSSSVAASDIYLEEGESGQEDSADEADHDQVSLQPKEELDDSNTTNTLLEAEKIMHHHDDSGTYTTCRSTDNESVGQPGDYNCQSSSRSSIQEDGDVALASNEDVAIATTECTSPSCLLLRQTLRQQEGQICFLRRKLQEYADLCERHDIGHDLLGKSKEDPLETVHSGTARTSYEEKTYADMMGPWDIPFHVELQPKDSFGEYSGITFAQHPSKMDAAVHIIRPCPTDDDDALPVVHNRYTKKSKRKSRSKSKQPKQHSSSPLAVERLLQRVQNSESSLPEADEDNDSRSRAPALLPPDNTTKLLNKNAKETSVKSMSVFLERKYGRQKALYSGTVHPNSGCPHGAGAFQFVKSSDVYIGEVAYGEMHGRGTYCHRKTNKLFRGDFARNSFVGSGRGDNYLCDASKSY